MIVFTYLLVAVVFVTLFALLVAAHEWGHYLSARMFRMGIEEFAIGMGKKIAIWRRRKQILDDGTELETEYTIRLLPIGGFVRIRGMEPHEDGSETKVANGFYASHPWKRLVVLFAGPLFSLLAGVIVLTGLYSFSGIDRAVNKPIIGSVSEKGAAFQAGMLANDRVVSIDGTPVNSFSEIVNKTYQSGGKPLSFVVERDSKMMTLLVTPILAKGFRLDSNLEPLQGREDLYRLGVSFKVERVGLTFGEALSEACSYPFKAIGGLLAIVKKPAIFEDSVGGPATIVSAVKSSVESSLYSVISLGGLLSISLGIMNLLPIAPLDGGQMVMAFVELLRGGRRLSFKVQNAVMTAGFMMVMLLMVSILFVDFRRFTGGDPNKPTPAASSTPAPKPSVTPATK
jgi:regulator of sigma E protease